MCLRPEILRAFAGFGDCVYPGGLLERRVKELVIITASERNDCQFCTNSHCDLVHIANIVDNPWEAIADTSGLAPRSESQLSTRARP
jgi:alkylhydroperoxidase family enzyme